MNIFKTHWSTFVALFILFCLFAPIVIGAEQKGTVKVPAVVMCKSPTAFEKVINAATEDEAKAVATKQIDSGQCVVFVEGVVVRVYDVPVDFFFANEGNAKFTVWQVWSSTNDKAYVFTAEVLTPA